METGDWIEKEDMNAWGEYDPLIDDPDDMPIPSTTKESPLPAATTAPLSAVEASSSLLPVVEVPSVQEEVKTGGSVKQSEECSSVKEEKVGSSEAEELRVRMNKIHDWFTAETSFNPSEVIERAQAHRKKAEDKSLLESIQENASSETVQPIDAMLYAAGGQIGKLSSWNSPAVQKYVQQFS
jgi:hypothetical protein